MISAFVASTCSGHGAEQLRTFADFLSLGDVFSPVFRLTPFSEIGVFRVLHFPPVGHLVVSIHISARSWQLMDENRLPRATRSPELGPMKVKKAKLHVKEEQEPRKNQVRPALSYP